MLCEESAALLAEHYQLLASRLTAKSRANRTGYNLAMAAVYLQQIFGDDFTKLELPFVAGMDAKAWLTLKTMIATKTNCPETSSMGRLFDVVSSLLCLRTATNYEGQAAIELEQIADRVWPAKISV